MALTQNKRTKTVAHINYKQSVINFTGKGQSMATIGEHLHSVATRADEAMARVEAEPLNVADYIESNEWKSIREYIKKIANRTDD